MDGNLSQSRRDNFEAMAAKKPLGEWLQEGNIDGSYWYYSGAIESSLYGYALEAGYKQVDYKQVDAQDRKFKMYQNAAGNRINTMQVRDRHNTIFDEDIKYLFTKIKTRLQVGQLEKVLIPINTGGHWRMINVEVTKNTNNTFAVNRNYYDPFGLGQVIRNIDESITRAFGDNLSAKNSTAVGRESMRQSDGSSCGPISCAIAGEIMKMPGASGNIKPVHIFPKGALALRVEHIQFTLKHGLIPGHHPQGKIDAAANLFNSQLGPKILLEEKAQQAALEPQPAKTQPAAPVNKAIAFLEHLQHSDFNPYHSSLFTIIIDDKAISLKAAQKVVDKANVPILDKEFLKTLVGEVFKEGIGAKEALETINTKILMEEKKSTFLKFLLEENEVVDGGDKVALKGYIRQLYSEDFAWDDFFKAEFVPIAKGSAELQEVMAGKFQQIKGAKTYEDVLTIDVSAFPVVADLAKEPPKVVVALPALPKLPNPQELKAAPQPGPQPLMHRLAPRPATNGPFSAYSKVASNDPNEQAANIKKELKEETTRIIAKMAEALETINTKMLMDEKKFTFLKFVLAENEVVDGDDRETLKGYIRQLYSEDFAWDNFFKAEFVPIAKGSTELREIIGGKFQQIKDAKTSQDVRRIDVSAFPVVADSKNIAAGDAANKPSPKPNPVDLTSLSRDPSRVV